MEPIAFLPEQVLCLCGCTPKNIRRLHTRRFVSWCEASVLSLKLHLYSCLHATKDAIVRLVPQRCLHGIVRDEKQWNQWNGCQGLMLLDSWSLETASLQPDLSKAWTRKYRVRLWVQNIQSFAVPHRGCWRKRRKIWHRCVAGRQSERSRREDAGRKTHTERDAGGTHQGGQKQTGHLTGRRGRRQTTEEKAGYKEDKDNTL